MFKSKSLKAGSKALIVGASTLEGRKGLIGKVCTLISFVPKGDTTTNVKPEFFGRFNPTSEEGWLVLVDGYKILDPQKMLIDQTKPIVSSKHLMPLDDPDLDKEIKLDSVRDFIREKFQKVW